MMIIQLLRSVVAPALPQAPPEYDKRFTDQYSSVLRLYFNQLDKLLRSIVSSAEDVGVYPAGTAADAFGRMRVSEPYTLFDSQNRYRADDQFSTSTDTGGSTTYLPYEASVSMAVTTTSGSEVIRQSYRSMPYQPGKGLLLLATFVMNAAKTGLRQRVGYFNASNGVFLQQADTTISFVLRSNSLPTPGTPSDIRTVPQADWNEDKMDGTGPSGRILDLTKNQIFWVDFEWLGTGDVRCGFYVDGRPVVCHTFHNDNTQISVYMQTAILPVRYEITNTGTTTGASAMKQICSTVISEAGFQQITIDHVARRTTSFTNIDTAATFYPIVSIRLASSALGAVVLPNNIQFMPLSSQYYEVALLKNPTLTGATWAATVPSTPNVEYDVAATAISNVGTIVDTEYVVATSSGGLASTIAPVGFNWDLQLGASLTNVSDIYTLAVRTVSGATKGEGLGSISFYDLTQ